MLYIYIIIYMYICNIYYIYIYICIYIYVCVYNNNQKSYMINENHRCKMIYSIKIIEKIFIYYYFGFTFQNPSLSVINIFTKLDIKVATN